MEDGGPVGEHTAEPALGHIGHAAAAGFFGDSFLRLALGANKEDHAAIADGLAHQIVGGGQGFDRLLKVNDVDAIALGEDEGAHGGVPFVGAMTEMDTTFQQGFHRNDSH